MSTITTRVQIENLGFKRADRLREGEWIVSHDRVGTVVDASFWDEHPNMVNVRIRFLGVSDEYGVAEQVQTVPRTHLFPCVNITTGLPE